MRNNDVTMAERQAFANVPVTLDGMPAKVIGYNKEFAIIKSRTDSVEFSWPTVKRIINSHCAFKS